LSLGLTPFDDANIRQIFYSANFSAKKMQFSLIFLEKLQIGAAFPKRSECSSRM
jgi:hypothetical protein